MWELLLYYYMYIQMLYPFIFINYLRQAHTTQTLTEFYCQIKISKVCVRAEYVLVVDADSCEVWTVSNMIWVSNSHRCYNVFKPVWYYHHILILSQRPGATNPANHSADGMNGKILSLAWISRINLCEIYFNVVCLVTKCLVVCTPCQHCIL